MPTEVSNELFLVTIKEEILKRRAKIFVFFIQWRAKVFGHHDFFKINPNDLSFFLEVREISLLNDVIRRFEKNAFGRNRKKNSKGRFFKFLCEPLMKIQKTSL